MASGGFASLEGCSRLRSILSTISPGDNLLVYHWDSDGAASAALVLRFTGEDKWGRVEVPRIGLYSASALPEPGKGTVLILDYGVAGRELDSYVSGYRARVAAADHHKVEPPSLVEAYCNPVALGLGDEVDYPACSLLIGRLLFTRPGPVERGLMALGVVGDLAPFVDSGRPHPALDLLPGLLDGTGLSLAELRRAVELVDSSYRVLDTECLRRAVRVLAADGVGGLFGLECALRNAERASGIVEEAFGRLERVYSDSVLEVYELVYDAYVTSAVGRRLASESPGKIVALVHSMPSQGTVFGYVRSVSRPLAWLRERLERSGLMVGGKTHVVVVEGRVGMEKEISRRIIEAVKEGLKSGG